MTNTPRDKTRTHSSDLNRATQAEMAAFSTFIGRTSERDLTVWFMRGYEDQTKNTARSVPSETPHSPRVHFRAGRLFYPLHVVNGVTDIAALLTDAVRNLPEEKRLKLRRALYAAERNVDPVPDWM
jgi:hypothetical protein